MSTRQSRKAKAAAADFVKRVIRGHDTSPSPSSSKSAPVASKTTKTQQKNKQIAKVNDGSKSPTRGRSPAKATKDSPAAKLSKSKTPAKASPSRSVSASPARSVSASPSAKVAASPVARLTASPVAKRAASPSTRATTSNVVTSVVRKSTLQGDRPQIISIKNSKNQVLQLQPQGTKSPVKVLAFTVSKGVASPVKVITTTCTVGKGSPVKVLPSTYKSTPITVVPDGGSPFKVIATTESKYSSPVKVVTSTYSATASPARITSLASATSPAAKILLKSSPVARVVIKDINLTSKSPLRSLTSSLVAKSSAKVTPSTDSKSEVKIASQPAKDKSDDKSNVAKTQSAKANVDASATSKVPTDTKASKEGDTDKEKLSEAPAVVKRGRGRPRKYPIDQSKPPPTPKQKVTTPPLVPGTRPVRQRGRPRKYPLPGEEETTPKKPKYSQKALTKQASLPAGSPKVAKKADKRKPPIRPTKSYSEPVSSYGSLNIVIKDDYMLQEGGMASPRHPTILCEQDEFFKIFGLIPKAELDERNARKHTLHRAAGGKLRRLIKPKISPEMVYRNFMLNKSAAVGTLPDEWDSSDEYDESSPIAKLAKSQSAPSSPEHRSLLAQHKALLAKAASLKEKDLVKTLKDVHFGSPDEDKPKKQWLKPPPKTPKRSSIEDALEAVKEIQDLTKTLKTPIKKQSSEPPSRSKLVKLDVKSKSMEIGKKPLVSSYRFKPSGGNRPLAPPPKIVEEEPSMAPSRRSARQRGGQRKQWWHLLRANPDEYIPDHEWEAEEAQREKKKQERIKKVVDDDSNDQEVPELEPEPPVKEKEINEEVKVKPKKKKKKKTKEKLEEKTQEEETKKDDEVVFKSPTGPALKRKVESSNEEPPAKVAKLETHADATPTDVITKKKKKKKKKHLEGQQVKIEADADQRGSVLRLNKGSKSRGYMVFDNSNNLISMHSDPVIYEQLANALVSLVKQEGWNRLGHEVIEVVMPKSNSLIVKERLRSQICERRASPSPDRVYEERESSCVTPHMCQVCWVNDHMYCTNMKRIARHLPKGGGCLHYTLCQHYRNLSPQETYARYATVAKFGSAGITRNFSISKLKNPEYTKRAKLLCEEGTSFTISGGRLLSSCDEEQKPEITIQVNNTAASEVQEKSFNPQIAEDLVCHEELCDSDTEAPEIAKSQDMLKKHLYVRARQIAQSLGYPSIQDAMEGLKKMGEKKTLCCLDDILAVDDDEQYNVMIQDYTEVEIQEFSDSDSDYEEEAMVKKYGVPLNSNSKDTAPIVQEDRMTLQLMPVLEKNCLGYFVKSKGRKVMKVQFAGNTHYNQEDQEWEIEDESFTMEDVTKSYLKTNAHLLRPKGIYRGVKVTMDSTGYTTIKKYPRSESTEGGAMLVYPEGATNGSPKGKALVGEPKVIWSSELDLNERSDGSKSSPEELPKKKKLNGDQTPSRRPDRSPLQSPELRGSASSSPCLSQGSASSTTSRSSIQGQQLLMASPVKLPKPAATIPSELQKNVTANKDGYQTLTFTTKDIRKCEPQLIQYIKSANLVERIHKTLSGERDSIKALLAEGEDEVSKLKDNIEQNECLLLAVKSEAKDVKEKLVDLEMSVITEQNKSNRFERRREKLKMEKDSVHKKMMAFKRAMERVNCLIATGKVPPLNLDENVTNATSLTVPSLPTSQTTSSHSAMAGQLAASESTASLGALDSPIQTNVVHRVAVSESAQLSTSKLTVSENKLQRPNVYKIGGTPVQTLGGTSVQIRGGIPIQTVGGIMSATNVACQLPKTVALETDPNIISMINH